MKKQVQRISRKDLEEYHEALKKQQKQLKTTSYNLNIDGYDLSFLDEMIRRNAVPYYSPTREEIQESSFGEVIDIYEFPRIEARLIKINENEYEVNAVCDDKEHPVGITSIDQGYWDYDPEFNLYIIGGPGKIIESSPSGIPILGQRITSEYKIFLYVVPNRITPKDYSENL
ncbi:MAG: hypothetical protein IKS54_06370 [Erysipelotrichaceae bacterium]|nr:hypothetical protein [Erysipelotrichaceae bacterium]